MKEFLLSAVGVVLAFALLRWLNIPIFGESDDRPHEPKKDQDGMLKP